MTIHPTAIVDPAAKIAPDVLWFQLYRCSRNEHAIGFDHGSEPIGGGELGPPIPTLIEPVDNHLRDVRTVAEIEALAASSAADSEAVYSSVRRRLEE